MRYFWAGLGCLAVGFPLWVMISIAGGLNEGTGGGRDPVLLGIVYASFGLMSLGPLFFWAVIPIALAVRYVFRRGKSGREPSGV